MTCNPELDHPYIIWVDNGSEGFAPHGYDTAAEAIEAIMNGLYGKVVLTQRLVLGVKQDNVG